MFRTSQPVTQSEFFDRERELQRLSATVEKLSAGAPEWLAIIGPRKVGKTSLLLEAARRFGRAGIEVVVFDVLDGSPVSVEAFRRLAGAVLDAVFAEKTGVAPSRLLRHPTELRSLLLRTDRYRGLDPDLQDLLLSLSDRSTDEDLIRDCLDLPERLSQALGIKLLIAIDEFQALAGVGSHGRGADPFPMMRSRWQRHQHVTYVISGSERTMLTELVTSERSPFFQHFALLDLDPLSPADGVRLLTESAPEQRPIGVEIAERAVAILGGHPFYLQLFGESLTLLDPPYDARALQETLQALLFSRTGRLSLYFENELQRIVGQSAGLASTLEALAEGPLRVVEIARKIRANSGAVTSYLSRLGDPVRARDDGRYELTDPAFAAWLRWRAPGGSVVSMRMLGDRAELMVAEHLSRMGFDLVYQSRGSRGAFDLMATRGADIVGVQVKRSALPLRFSKAAWNRMAADAAKWGWLWIIAAVDDDDGIALLDPRRATKREQARVGENARIENLLAWIAEAEAKPKAGKKRIPRRSPRR